MTGTYLGFDRIVFMVDRLPWQIFRATTCNGLIDFVDHLYWFFNVDVTSVLPTTTGSIAVLVTCSCGFRDQPAVVHEMMKEMISPIYCASAVALCHNCRLPKNGTFDFLRFECPLALIGSDASRRNLLSVEQKSRILCPTAAALRVTRFKLSYEPMVYGTHIFVEVKGGHPCGQVAKPCAMQPEFSAAY
jgi:hypothetical protein